MNPADVTPGATVHWRGRHGTVIGWAEPRPEGQRRGRGDLVNVRLSDSPEFAFLWDREGRYTRRVPLKALKTRPKTRPTMSRRAEKTDATCAGLDVALRRVVEDVRGAPPDRFAVRVKRIGAESVEIGLSAQEATALLAFLEGRRPKEVFNWPTCTKCLLTMNLCECLPWE